MKKVLIITIVGLFNLSLFAQNSQKAQQLIQDITKQIQSYKNISLTFDYTINGKVNNGSISIEGNKYNATFSGVTQINNGKKLYTINPEDEEVIVSNITKKSGAITPSDILSFYTKGYNYSWGKTQNLSGKNIQFIALKPTAANSTTKEVLLGIDTKSKMIYQIVETFKNGKKSTITIKSVKTNQSLPANLFVFNKSNYPNYYINNIE